MYYIRLHASPEVAPLPPSLLQEESTMLFDDLRLCAVKPLDSIDRRFCFELVSVQK